MSEMIIDLGCGNNPREGAIGVDILPYENTAVQGDVCHLPISTESVDRVYASQLFEHLDGEQLATVFEEVCRVLKPGGELAFDVPHGRAWDSDPTHQTKWLFKTIVYYLPRSEVRRLGWSPETFPDYYRDYDINFKLVNRDATAWLDVKWLPLRGISFLVRKLSEHITTDRWEGLPLGAALLTFRLRKSIADAERNSTILPRKEDQT